MKSERRGLVLVVAVILISAVLGGIYGPNVGATTSSAEDEHTAIRQFANVLDVVQANYAESVDVDKAVYQGAIPGMLRVLDPHSNFFDARQFALLREDQRGKYYGVGMVVAPRESKTVVVQPYVGAPAFNAGIRPGDVIMKVDDKATDGLTTTDVADMLKGPKGTVVKITVSREGYEQQLVFTVTRDEIPRHSVDIAFMLKPGVGYIRLSGFNETTDREIADALRQLNAPSLDGLILDMRGNPGGLLNEAVAVSDMFLDKGQLIVSHHGRSSPNRPYIAIRGNQGMTTPLVILVNGNSASATEIVSGAVQDHDRGLIVGETTFGKGLVQTVQPLSENTGLALTTARYYTPSGRLIQRDYKSISLYEYHYERKVPEHPTEVRLTDSGRQVTGGGGITPDIVVTAPKLNHFQENLFRADVFYPYEGGVGGFTRFYMGNKPVVTREFEANDDVMKTFREFLTKHNVRYTEPDMSENLDWVKRKIRQEVLVSNFGMQEGFKVQLEADPQVQKAVEAIPQARALYQNVRKIVAQRAGGTLDQQP
ncbi:MAG TPA: S41 family peptidase [Verrucomicrobiae bacterium]|jgi:carboxyl-terminal processing protease|nr:S41 family peptidase [Verrucomicrobiae bacterium]